MTDSPTPTSEEQQQTASRPPIPRRQSFIERLQSSPATAGLIVATGLVFLVQFISQQIFQFDLLLAMGAKDNQAILRGQIWRYVTPILLHVGLAHFFVNMYSLYVIGPSVERPFGAVRFLVIYALTGLGGVAASLAFSQASSAGASGAIFGILGALAGFLYLHREILGSAGSGQLRNIILIALVNLAIGLSPGIDNWGHLGGLLSGVALSFWLGPRYQVQWSPDGVGRMVDQRKWDRIWPRAALAGLLMVLLLLAATMVAARFQPLARIDLIQLAQI